VFAAAAAASDFLEDSEPVRAGRAMTWAKRLTACEPQQRRARKARRSRSISLACGRPCVHTNGKANGPFTWMSVYADNFVQVRWRGQQFKWLAILSIEHPDILDIIKRLQPNLEVAVRIPNSFFSDLSEMMEIGLNVHEGEEFVSGESKQLSRHDVLAQLVSSGVHVILQDNLGGGEGIDITWRIMRIGETCVGGTINLAASENLAEIVPLAAQMIKTAAG
jgi:hypothetical protein